MPAPLVVLVKILCKVFWFPFSSWSPILVGSYLYSEREIGRGGMVVAWLIGIAWLAVKKNVTYPAAWLERLGQAD